MILQYWQGLGCKQRQNTVLEYISTNCYIYIYTVQLKNTSGQKQDKLATHCSELFDILSTFLADCIRFTAKKKHIKAKDLT